MTTHRRVYALAHGLRARPFGRSTAHSDQDFLEVFPMPERVTTIDFPLAALFRRLAGNLMIVIVFGTTAIGLTQLNAVAPRPSAAPEFSDPPGSGLIVCSKVIHLWLPETLLDPAGHQFSDAGRADSSGTQGGSRTPRTGKPLVRNHRSSASGQPPRRRQLVHPISIPPTRASPGAYGCSDRSRRKATARFVCGLLGSQSPHHARGDVKARMARVRASIVAFGRGHSK